MTLSLELTESQDSQLRALAARLHISAEALAAAVLRDLLSAGATDLAAAARSVGVSVNPHRPSY